MMIYSTYDQCGNDGNLQLLEALPNIEKKDSDFDQWIAKTIPTPALSDYKSKHLIPQNVDLTYENFEDFFTECENLIVDKLKSELM